MSGHGVPPVPHASASVPSGGARPRRPPDSATKLGGHVGSSLPNDGKSLISSKRSFCYFTITMSKNNKLHLRSIIDNKDLLKL